MTSLKKLAVRGAIWTIAGYGASNILRLASSMIMTRLLFPELFGLMSLVGVFLIGLHLFSDIGLGPNIVQSKRGDDPDFLNTAWTMQIVRSFGIWILCFLIAWPAASFYSDNRLLWLIPIVGLNTVISGFASTAVHTLDRHMSVKQQTIFRLTEQLISVSVTVIWAFFSPTIWALVAGGLAGAIFQTFWSFRLIPGTVHRFTWEQKAVTEIFHYGKWIFVSTAITFFAEQIDRLLLGKLLSLQMLGVYGVASALADTPRSITLALNGQVIFPAIAKVADLPRDEIRSKILKNRRLLLIGLTIGLSVLVCFGDVLISLLYDRRYSQAAWMLPILTLGIWPRVLCNTNEPALFAIGKPYYTAIAMFSRFVFTTIVTLLGFHLFGFIGAIIAIALNDLFYYVVINYGLLREGFSCLVQDLQATLLLLVLIAAILIVRSVLGFGLPIQTLFL